MDLLVQQRFNYQAILTVLPGMTNQISTCTVEQYMTFVWFTELLIDKRASNIDHIAKKPAVPEGMNETSEIKLDFFPTLDSTVLNTEDTLNK